VIYSQVRVGQSGRPFRIHKFRSMRQGPPHVGSAVTVDHDPRITRVGRFLRKTKLDELPQLWNVLRGEMSLVGARPDVPEIIGTYTVAMRRVLDVRPGLTSIASLWLRNETHLLQGVKAPEDVYKKVIVPAKVQLALTHVDRRSLAFDWGVLVATLGAWLGLRRPSQAEQQFLAQLKHRIAAYSTADGLGHLFPKCLPTHHDAHSTLIPTTT